MLESQNETKATLGRAVAGDAEAQNTIGKSYAIGSGVPQHDEQAYVWFDRAAGQGHTQAQFNLGLLLEEGRGVKAATDEAAQWYVKAADTGLAAGPVPIG